MHPNAYLLANYVDENGAGHSGSVFAKSRVLEIELATNMVSIRSETDTTKSPRWIAQDIALAEDTIVAMRELDPAAPLTSIALTDGTRTVLAPDVKVGGMALVSALNNGRVYVATFDGVDEIDVNAGSKRNISPVDDNHPLTFSQVRSIGFDLANNRVIIGEARVPSPRPVWIDRIGVSPLQNRGCMDAGRRAKQGERESSAIDTRSNETVSAAEGKRMDFGELDDGTRIEAVELSNGRGVSARVITLGATVQALSVPDRDGNSADIVLGYASPRQYLKDPQYFGATVGRYANRIKEGRFTLEGVEYRLPTNDGPNHLHGGPSGLDKVVWTLDSVESGSPARAVLTCVSPDGDGGYPGTLEVTAIYSLGDPNDLTVEYRATTDKPTIVNVTNHSYFNLAGEAGNATVMAQRLRLFADRFTPVDATLIPTGERRDVVGTPFDFREPKPIGRDIRDGSSRQIVFGRGYDHNFIVNGEAGTLRAAATIEDPVSGRVLELLVTAPGVQVYSGNGLDATTVGKSGRVYRPGDALCLEPQVFPDSPNQPDFPSARLDPGETYINKMVFRFSTAGF